ncbi:hypothetical protein [Oceaniglobus roseus]|uniref:hypothetical protein n=1 Tax=Oceaniglobus roseus TaxID=1737570 RepID=UPI000C7EF2EF|nr:hypothetical protein [Kandeliimicrobium roseum]
MIKKLLAVGALVALASCSGGVNPFNPDTGGDNGGGNGGGDDGTPITRDGLPPGTASPTPSSTIFRKEARDANGNGYAENIAYDGTTDTFLVDNLAFDGVTSGQSVYARGTAVSSLGPFAVYESATVADDVFNGQPINQFAYRAIYGVSNSGNTQFAIVRTGSYVNYGFGGFIYQRDTGVTLPTTGQGSYTGQYAGLRDFDGVGGLEYTQGDAAVQVDFEDFNDGQGVTAQITNRRIFDIAGNDVTQDVISAWNTANPTNTIGALPVIRFRIGDGVADANGELAGEAFSNIGGEGFEAGNFYAMMAGPNAEEITGVVVVTSTDPRFPSTPTVRETGGFIVYR